MGAIFSYPLPKKHWLYAEREYIDGEVEPIELPRPILTRADRDTVVAAIRYAVRAATNCGKEPDFDPDALVLNAAYALCGPANQSPEQLPAAQPITEAMMEVVDRLGSEYDQVDPRVWEHMLAYAPNAPVAQEPFCYHDGRNIVDKEFAGDSDVFPLYTAPPQRKPLTDEDIEQAQREVWRSLPSDFDYTTSSWIELGIRYAEAAHDIKETP